MLINFLFSEMTANDLRRIELEIEYGPVVQSCNNVLNSKDLEDVELENSEKSQENNYTIAHDEQQDKI